MSLLAIDVGAEDVNFEDGMLEIFTAPEQLFEVRRGLESADAKPETVEISMVPKSTVPLGEREAEQTLKLLDNLEDLAGRTKGLHQRRLSCRSAATIPGGSPSR